MRKQLPRLDMPLNVDERLLYAIAVRLDRIIELLDNDVQVEEPIVVEEIVDAEVDYKSLTKVEIKEILIDRKIDYNDRMNKAELIELVI